MKNIILLFVFVCFFSQKTFAQYYKIELVKDILSGNIGSAPQDLVNAGGNLYFVANDGIHGKELWKSNGTAAGTQMVMDINPNGNVTSDPGALITIGDNVFFRANDGMYGFELWRSQFNGVGAGTTTMVKDINPFGNSNPAYLTNTNGTLKFAANDGLNGEELWHSDGTTIGTHMVEDLVPGIENGSYPNGLFAVNNRVFFRNNLNAGLYSANATNITGPIEVESYNDEDLSPLSFAKINNTLLFSGKGNGLFFDIGRELFYKQEGEPVKLLKDINFGPESSSPIQLTPVGNILYFLTSDDTKISLWKSGELGATVLVKTFDVGIAVGKLIGVGNELYFFVHNSTETQLWKSRGTLATTELVKSLNTNLVFYFPEVFDFNGTLIFSILDPIKGKEIWQSNGDAENTFVIKDLNPGVNGSDSDHFTVIGDYLYFSADDGVNGRELYKMHKCIGSDKNYTIKNGNWGDPSTWSCGRVPITTEGVTIKGHTININGNFGINHVIFEGGTITMPIGSTLTSYAVPI